MSGGNIMIKDNEKLHCLKILKESINNIINEELTISDEYKWRICYPYTWIEEIANYLFIYKTFDWENNVIFVYGG